MEMDGVVGFSSDVTKNKVVKCDHFSIRGYVADIRRKDLKICWPFSPPGGNEVFKGTLADMLPALHIPEFTFWDCQKCIQTSDVSVDATDVSPVVLEMIYVGKKDAANTLVITMPNTEQDVHANNHDTMERGVYRLNQSIDELKNTECHKGVVNLNLEASALSGYEGTSYGITQNGPPNIAKILQHYKNADGVSFRRRKLCPCESSDDEDGEVHILLGQLGADHLADPSRVGVSFRRRIRCPCESSDDEDAEVHILLGQLGADHLADPSRVTSCKRTRKFRLISDILKDENSVVSTKISNFKRGIHSGHEVDHTEALVLYDQTSVENGIEEEKKKRKEVQDKDRNSQPVRCSKSLTKSQFQWRDQDKKDFDTSDGSYGDGVRQFRVNGKHRKDSQNHIGDNKTLFEDRGQQHDIKACEGFANEGNLSHKIMGKDREVGHVEVATAPWGLKSKRGSSQKGRKSDKRRNANQIQVRACPLRTEDCSLLCKSEKKNLNQTDGTRNQSSDRGINMGESEALDDVSLEIVELLAQGQHERRCHETQNADQIKLSTLVKTLKVKDSENPMGESLKKIRQTCKRNNFDERNILPSFDKNGSLVSSSSHPNHCGVTQSVEAATAVRDQVCWLSGDKLINENPNSYCQCSTSHPTCQKNTGPVKMQGRSNFSQQSQDGDDLRDPIEVLSDRPCTYTQKGIGTLAKPVELSSRFSNRYMPATELLQLMDAGMCPTIPHPEKLNQYLIRKAGISIEQLTFRCGSTKDLSRQQLNYFNKDYRNLGMCSYPNGPMSYPDVYPVYKHENSALHSKSKESQIIVSETDKSGNWKRGKKQSTNVAPSKVGSLALKPNSLYYPIAGFGVGSDLAMFQLMNLGIEICSMNRNPADFTVPGRVNQFMIGFKGLKVGKTISEPRRRRKLTMKVQSLSEHARK